MYKVELGNRVVHFDDLTIKREMWIFYEFNFVFFR